MTTLILNETIKQLKNNYYKQHIERNKQMANNRYTIIKHIQQL